MPGGSAANLRGLALLMAGDLPGALAAFDSAIAADPKAIEPRFNRAIALLRRGESDRAGAALEALAPEVAGGPLASTVAYHRALAARNANDPETALAWALRAAAADPRSADAHLLSGILLEGAGRYEDAGKRYKALLDLDPRSPVGMLRFGIVAQRAGHRELSTRYLRELVRSAPSTPEAIEARKYLVMWE